jgi:RNA polymerase-binding protein DksA
MAKKKAVKTNKTAAKKKVSRPAKKKAVRKNAPKNANASQLSRQNARGKGYGQRDLQHFRAIILDKRKEILDELQILKESMMDVTTGEYATENSTYSMHMEQGTDAMEREKTFLYASREGKFLNYLDDALKRIEKGTYGACTDCGKLIERERLEAVPHAQLCVRCKIKRGR